MKCGEVITRETRRSAVITERASLPTWLERLVAAQDVDVSDMVWGIPHKGTFRGRRPNGFQEYLEGRQ